LFKSTETECHTFTIEIKEVLHLCVLGFVCATLISSPPTLPSFPDGVRKWIKSNEGENKMGKRQIFIGSQFRLGRNDKAQQLNYHRLERKDSFSSVVTCPPPRRPTPDKRRRRRRAEGEKTCHFPRSSLKFLSKRNTRLRRANQRERTSGKGERTRNSNV